MKTTIRLSFLLAIIFITSSCFSGKQMANTNSVILPLSDSTALRDGSIVYGLPRTVFTVVVDMERSIDRPGPYSQYAGDLLGLTDIIRTETESWSIKSITVKAHDELDPDQYYAIASTTLFQTNVLALRKEGLILDLNPSIFRSTEKQSEMNEAGISVLFL